MGGADLTAALRSAEDELARLRVQLRAAAAFVNNPVHDLGARRALAALLNIPAPAAPKEAAAHGQ